MLFIYQYDGDLYILTCGKVTFILDPPVTAKPKVMEYLKRSWKKSSGKVMEFEELKRERILWL